MSSLTYLEKNKIEKLFEMASGYVLNFSDQSLRRFILDSAKIDISDAKYEKFGTSKANKLRAIWEIENDELAGKLIEDIIRALQDEDVAVNKTEGTINQDLIDKCLSISLRLQSEEKNEHKESINVEEFLKIDVGEIPIRKLDIDAKLIEILDQRIKEAEKCLKVEAPLSVIVLCGSILEGLLLGIASKKPKEFNQSSASPKDKISGKVKQFQEWTLNNLIDVAEDIGFISLNIKKYSHSLRDFRNYIHPSQQISSTFDPNMDTARISWQVLKAAINDIFERVK